MDAKLSSRYQAKFREKVPLALYYHCGSHQLNLVLSKASAITSIQCNLKELGIFLNYSPKRQRQLEASFDIVRSTTMSKLLKVKILCETRWVERHTALTDFNEMYEAVVHCLETVSNNYEKGWNGKSVTEGQGLLTKIISISFIVAFQINLLFFLDLQRT